MPKVDYVRPELTDQLNAITLVSDLVAGPDRVKSKQETYLPRPDPGDTSHENKERYKAYVLRAILLGATQQTLEALVGQVFAKDPASELPSGLEFLANDIDGQGSSLDETAKKALRYILQGSRAGILIDYPRAPEDDQPRSREAERSLGLRPIITVWPTDRIVNWREGARGLEMVNLREDVLIEDDGFEPSWEIGYRQMVLEEGVVAVKTWRKKKSSWENTETTYPQDNTGKKLTKIPFIFAGWRDNKATPDPLPLESLARLEIGHYRNSADYEEACFIAGQPTPVFAGVTENWVTSVMKGVVRLGSRSGVPLPAGATASLLQPSPNSMPKEAMELKEAQMAKIGAKLVEPGQVAKTATEASLQASAESSVLGSASSNASKAIEEALRFAALFAGVEIATDSGENELLSYELNTDFSLARLSSQDRAQLLAEWQGGGIAYSEYRWNLKRGGVVYLDDEKAKEEIANELP